MTLVRQPRQIALKPAISCAHSQGKQHSRAATELGITVATIRRRIQSAKAMLRSRFAGSGIPVSMFLLHVLMDNLAAGVDSVTASAPAAPPATRLPTAPQHSPPQLTGSRPSSFGAWLTMQAPGFWAVTAGLLAVAIGVIPVLHHFLSEDDRPPLSSFVAAQQDAPQPVVGEQLPEADNVRSLVASRRLARPIQGAALPPPLVTPEWNVEQRLSQQPVPEVEPTTGLISQTEIELAESVAVSMEPDMATHDVDELFGIEWHTTLESARASAHEEPARPILCFRVLGELSGFM